MLVTLFGRYHVVSLEGNTLIDVTGYLTPSPALVLVSHAISLGLVSGLYLVRTKA